MPAKNEQQPPNIPVINNLGAPPFVSSLGYRYLWNTLNFATIALSTSLAVVAVQSPIRTLLVNYSKTNVLIPIYKGGMFSLVRALYAGTQASLSGSTIRTAYISKTKSNKPKEGEEFVCEEEIPKAKPSKLAYVLEASLGMVAITQIPTQLSDYRKSGLIPPQFRWHSTYNLIQLMSSNFIPKYGASLINLSSLCLIEQAYAERLTEIAPDKVRFVSGALSGATAAVFNYPFAAFVDYNQAQTKVIGDRIINKGVVTSLKEVNNMFWSSPKSSATFFIKNAATQLPLRVLSTASVFSIVAGVSNILGPEPLAKVVAPQYIPPVPYPSPIFFKPVKHEVGISEEEIERLISRSI